MKGFAYFKPFQRVLLLIALLLPGISMLEAQQTIESPPKDIFEVLSANVEGEGNIFIRQPKELRILVGKVSRRDFQRQGKHESLSLTSGYRIQAYNGNLPNSKQEAYERASTLSKLFPGEVCYITYRAPFWRLVMGDYTTLEEAREALSKLKEQVPPAMLSELYIVKDKIRIQP